jgi:WD40 repeat protein
VESNVGWIGDSVTHAGVGFCTSTQLTQVLYLISLTYLPMSYCLNPICKNPQNHGSRDLCQSCEFTLRLQHRYVALKPIGQGGFGRTFLASNESEEVSSPCVIKQFFPQQQGNNSEHTSQLFCQEALRLQELGKHPQIPSLLDYFEQDGYQYLIQEFVDGNNLAQELATEGAFREPQIRQLLMDVLPVLQFIHEHQVIHRDIKPANIIRRSADHTLFLVDLGAAKHTMGTALVITGTVIGSAEYIAPEQARGKAVFASDLYSLGTTCIHLLTELSPFDLFDGSDDRWVWQTLVKHPVSDSLKYTLNKMLHHATKRRYRSVDEVLTDLKAARVKDAKHSRTAAIVSVLISSLLISLGFISWLRRSPSPQPLTASLLPPVTLSSIASIPSPIPSPNPQPQHDGSLLTLNGHSSPISSLAISPDGEFLVSSSSGDAKINFWHFPTGSLVHTLAEATDTLAISPDGQILATSSGVNIINVGEPSGRIKLWNFYTREFIYSLSAYSDPISSIAFSPDGQILAAGGNGLAGNGPVPGVELWNLRTGESIPTSGGDSDTITESIAISPDGHTLVSASEIIRMTAAPNLIEVWNTRTGERARTLQSRLDLVFPVTISPDGQTIVSAGESRGRRQATVELWDLRTNQLIRSFRGQSDRVNCVAISPNGRTLSIGGNDGAIELWDLHEGTLIRSLGHHSSSINAIVISPDGRILVSGGGDGTIKLWSIE